MMYLQKNKVYRYVMKVDDLQNEFHVSLPRVLNACGGSFWEWSKLMSFTMSIHNPLELHGLKLICIKPTKFMLRPSMEYDYEWWRVATIWYKSW